MKAKTNPDQQNQLKKKYQPPKAVRSEDKKFLSYVGNRLLELRNDRDISISELSKQLCLSRNAYAQMEKGMTYFNLLNLFLVLDYHGITPEEFFKKI